MEQKHRTILRSHWSSIRDDLEPKDILPKLVTVLIETDEEEIKAQSTRQERCDKLLEILPRKGPTAFKVFVEALKQTVPHVADLIEADKKTEDEPIDPTKQSAKLLTGIFTLQKELETEKQNRIKTLQGLKKMKSPRGKGNETKEEEITPDGLQKEETTTESLSKKEQGQKRQKKKIKEEEESLLQKCDHLDEKNKQEKQSENLEAAKEAQEKVTEKTLEFEKILAREQQMEKLKYFEHFQAQSEVKDVLLEKMRLKNKRLHKQSNARRSKCDALSEEVRRLKEILGHESCSRCEGLRNERDSATRENQTLNRKIQELINIIKKNNEYYQEEKQVLQNSLERVKSENENLQHRLSESLEAAKKDQEQMIRQLTTENKELKQEVTKKNSEVNKILAREQKKNKKLKDSRDKFRAEVEAKDVELQKMREENKRLHEEINAEKPKCDDDLREEVGKLCQMPWPGRIHSYVRDFDSNGVVYALVRNSWRPNSTQTSITATRSSDEEGNAIDILENRLDREIVSGTKAQENSWWCVDLTENYALYLTHYTLRHGHKTSFSHLLNWQLQGSHDGQSWETLRTHDIDRGLKGKDPYCTCTWSIRGNVNAFRYFRILQTGKNSSGNFGIFLSGIELYGVLIEISSQCWY